MHHTHQPLRAGAMTVLTTVVVFCLAILAVLSVTTATGAELLSNRALTLVDLQNRAECTGQEWLAALDAARADGNAALPEGTTRAEGGTLAAALPIDGTHTLYVAADPDTLRPTRWQLETEWHPDETETLWPGA